MNNLPARRGTASPEANWRVEIPADLRRRLHRYPQILKLLDELLQLPWPKIKSAGARLLLLMIVLDDSGSIRVLKAEKLLAAGADWHIQTQPGGTIVSVWRLNDRTPVLHLRPRGKLEPGVVPSFRASGGTPMHERFALALLYQLAMFLRYDADPNVAEVTTSTGICGDGVDDGAGAGSDLPRIIVEYMLSRGHDVWAKGCGHRRTFEYGFGAMGIPRDRIEVVKTMKEMAYAMAVEGERHTALAIERGVKQLRQ